MSEDSARVRAGAAVLTVGLALTFLSFTLVSSVGSPPSAPQERAFFVVSNAGTYQLSGLLGVVGNALLATGALFLATRHVAMRKGMPASAFWLFVAVGGLIFVGLDAFKARGLVPLAEAYVSSPEVYVAAEAMRSLMVGLGMLLMTTGTFFVFLGEAGAVHSPVPRAFAWAAAAASVVVAVGALGLLVGYSAMSVLLVAAYVVFLGLLLMSVKLAWRPEEEPVPFARVTRA